MPSNLEPRYFLDPHHRWKPAMIRVVQSTRWSHALTLSWNVNASLEQIRKDTGDFIRRVEKKVLRCSRPEGLAQETRIKAFFVAEGMAHGHPHVHSLWRCPPGKLLTFNRLFPGQRGGLWNRIAQKGSYDLDMVSFFGSNDEFAGYLLKGQHKDSDPGEMFWSDEFWRSR